MAVFGLAFCVDDAYMYAWRRGHDQIGTAHLLLALAVQGDPVGSRVLLEAGVTYPALNELLSQDSWREAHAELPSPEISLHGYPAPGTAWPGRRVRALLPFLFSRDYIFPPDLPRPRWSTTMRSVLKGRGHTRAEQLTALLAHRDSAASEALASLGTSSDRLLEQVEAAYAPEGPRRFGQFDEEMRPAARVIRWAMRTGPYEPPGSAFDLAWRNGLFQAVMSWAPARQPEAIVFALLKVYEELTVDSAQLGDGWEDCFPAVRPLIASGMTSADIGELAPPLNAVERLGYVASLTTQGKKKAAEILRRPVRRKVRASVEVTLIGALAQESPALDDLLNRFGLSREGLMLDVARSLTA
jgi:hypothetical protein